MAVAKVSSLESLVVLIPYFVKDSYSYLLAWVLTFWIGKGLVEYQIVFIIIGLLIAMIWLMILLSIFKRKGI